ncbi:hypothetical protein OG895_43415 [Streptomyces sp. NBC_00201]|uniref:hypothetical protein n=1 Tax=unclassified Streptomyces TaxID=2593676 RepID=UPI00224DC05A|nr:MULTISPECIES: hypothetical protein [unclassified Streptomyces]MCX5063745.1 hypothetical protein [Streptomyces sp. NBC_00452]MCX5251900.1 hypothetical protein [Streptomyces sp. NBC_00201]MCX5294197.1 hypothetical protein [Streptomyces sp. NBC_00183]
MTRREDHDHIDDLLTQAQVMVPGFEFDDAESAAMLSRIARRALSRATDAMDECARLVTAEAPGRPRPEPMPANPPVYRRAAMNLADLSCRVVRDPDTVEAMAQLVNSRSRIEPAGALTFACLLYLSDRSEGAQFWWQFAAGSGVATAAYCLYLHHTQCSEDDIARFWYRQALTLHHHTGGDLYPRIDTEPPTPLTNSCHTPRAVAAAIAAITPLASGDRADVPTCATAGVFSWALDHFKLADAVCRLEADSDEDYGLVPRPDPALAVELEEHMEHAP